MTKNSWNINIQKEIRKYDNLASKEPTCTTFYKKNKAKFTLNQKNQK